MPLEREIKLRFDSAEEARARILALERLLIDIVGMTKRIRLPDGLA